MERTQDKRKGLSTSWLVMELAVVFSVLSQINSVARFTRPAMYAMWILAIIVGITRTKGNLKITQFSARFILAYILFLIFCAITSIIDTRHISANYIRVLIVPLLVTVVGEMYADEDRELFNRLGKLYLISSVIFAFWVQRTYFPSYSSWLSARRYLFQSKNSAGQIWVAAIFLSLLLVQYKNRFQRVLAYIACFYLLVMTGMSQCRTALLGMAVATVAFAISRAKHKGRWIALVVLAAAAAWYIPVTRRFIEQALFLNKYAGADLDTFSSGRISRYETALASFLSSPVIGVGQFYVDSSYILILTESGLIGFLLIEWIWVKKIGMCFRYRGEFNEQVFLFMMTTFYIVESMLEGFPPFGPGVSSFVFWFMSSVLLNRTREDKKINGAVKAEEE